MLAVVAIYYSVVIYNDHNRPARQLSGRSFCIMSIRDNNRKKIHRQIVARILDRISVVIPCIHKMELFAFECLPLELRSALPSFQEMEADSRRPIYSKMAFFYLDGVKFKMYYMSPSNRPDVKIEVVSPTPSALVELAIRIPSIKISSVEYAIDFMCRSPNHVAEVHWLLRRYGYFPYRYGKVQVVGGNYAGMDIDRVENCVTYIWNAANCSNAIKVYERGADSRVIRRKGRPPCWHVKNIDRLRLEFTFTISRDRGAMDYLGIRSLSGFAESPKMSEMFEGEFRFCCFEGSSQLPVEWGDYMTRDSSGCIDCFQCEFVEAKATVKGASQYLADSDLMEPLMLKIQAALMHHDIAWQRESMAFLHSCYWKRLRWMSVRRRRGQFEICFDSFKW